MTSDLPALLDLLRAKGVRAYKAADVEIVFGAEPSPFPITSTTTSTADIERELAEEAARPKDALALAMTAGNDHGGEE